MVPRAWKLAPFLVMPAVAAIALAWRVPLAIDETRYLTVAWEMYSGSDWLVPHLNGSPYTHKPPLLFWAIVAGWKAFGVNEWWPRLVPLLAGLAALGTLWRLARRLWPDVEDLPAFAVILAAGMLLWAAVNSLIMFDLLLTLWVLVALVGLKRAGDGDSLGWTLFGTGMGLALLTKGPVALLHLLPVAALAPWWGRAASRNLSTWYLRLSVWCVVGMALVLAWALPATETGGEYYARTLLWTQTVDRIAVSFAHQRPWWWYLHVLPLLVLPWTLWRPALQGLAEGVRCMEPGTRFCLAWAVPVFLGFCLISGKQPQYLLPLLPALALLAARGLGNRYAMSYRGARALALLPMMVLGLVMAAALWPGGDWHRGWLEDLHPAWTAAYWAVLAWAILPFRVSLLEGAARLQMATTLALAVAAAGLLGSAAGRAYGVAPAAREVADLQRQGVTVGYFGDYHGQLGFAGRLRQPLVELPGQAELRALSARDPAAMVVIETRRNPLTAAPLLPVSVMTYRTGYWSIWSAKRLAANPQLLETLAARGPKHESGRTK